MISLNTLFDMSVSQIPCENLHSNTVMTKFDKACLNCGGQTLKFLKTALQIKIKSSYTK